LGFKNYRRYVGPDIVGYQAVGLTARQASLMMWDALERLTLSELGLLN
jgi:hypothetical protein